MFEVIKTGKSEGLTVTHAVETTRLLPNAKTGVDDLVTVRVPVETTTHETVGIAQSFALTASKRHGGIFVVRDVDGNPIAVYENGECMPMFSTHIYKDSDRYAHQK